MAEGVIVSAKISHYLARFYCTVHCFKKKIFIAHKNFDDRK
jgi:hypothetical protein